MVDAQSTPIKPKRKPSLVVRLTAAVAAVLLLGATAALYSAWNYGKQASNEAYDRLLTGAALQIVEQISIADGELIVDMPVSAFELLALARNDRIFYRVIGVDGETLTGYDELPSPTADDADAYDGVFKGTPIRAVQSQRVITERAISGVVRVIVAQTVLERTQLARDIATRAAILVAVASLSILLLSYVGVRYALQPLTRVEQALLARDPNDLSPFDIETPRELETVVSAINRFTRRLDRRVTAVQSFVADAAHQLRTPITAIRAQAQLASDETSPDRLRRISRRIHDRSVAVSRLADQLLAHAMITHRADMELRDICDLRRIALEAEEETMRFSESGQAETQFDLAGDESVLVAGDRFSLREAVKNLLNNAHTHGKAPVILRALVENGQAVVSVRDGGGGIDADLRASVGARFRAQGSAKGAGLGLAIAHEVAQAHGGHIGFHDVEGGGFEIRMELPLISEERT